MRDPALPCLPGATAAHLYGVDGSGSGYERLLLPFGNGCDVEQIVGSYKAISIEGGFKINNLMGITPKATPVSIIAAVIELDFVPGPASHRTSDDIIELG